MIGTITEHLLVQYMDSEVDHERMIPTIVRRLLPIPEEQESYAKEHIGEEVEFVRSDSGRNGDGIPIAWIQIGIMERKRQAKEKKELERRITYSEEEVRQLLMDLVDTDNLYVSKSRSDQYDFVNEWFEKSKKK